MRKIQGRALLIIFLWILAQIGAAVKIFIFTTLKSIIHIFRPLYTVSKTPQFNRNRFSLKTGSIVLLPILLFIYSYYLIVLASALPNPKRLSLNESPATTEFYDRKGRLLYKLYEGRNRTPVTLNDLPKHLIQATIASEDQNFYYHPGFDPSAVLRAALAYFHTHNVQGGSTITQQLIKNTLLTPDRSLQRKIKEVILAFWAERIYSKGEILTMYFNESPYGGPAWGVEAAAETYFDKKPKDLTLAESSYIAGLPASPTAFSPYGAYPELGKDRQKQVLRRMAEEGYISSDQADKAISEELKIIPPKTSIKAPHFVMYLRSILAQKYGERTVSQGGLKVVTTLDLEIQQMAEEIVREEVGKLAALSVSNGAAMIQDPKTGEVLAMVGSKDYFDPENGNFNVTTALRQPGSAIKPITYAAGFKQGYTPGTVLLDTPVVFKSAWETYTPVNYDNRFHGPVTTRTALGSSYNIPAVKMLAIVGIPNMIQTAKDLGVTSFENPDKFGLSLTLGGGEVKMADLINVYSTFANTGIRQAQQLVLKITDSSGEVLEEPDKEAGQRVLSEGVSYLITDILSDNNARTPAFGPNSLLYIPGHRVAAKTGTTDNKKDNWAFGYTPDFAVGAWVGNNNGEPMHPQLTSGVTGASTIWNRIMTSLIAEYGSRAFAKPDEVIEVTVDGRQDLGLVGQTPKHIVALSKKKMKDSETSEEKEAITFTDPFSIYTPAEGRGTPQR